MSRLHHFRGDLGTNKPQIHVSSSQHAVRGRRYYYCWLPVWSVLSASNLGRDDHAGDGQAVSTLVFLATIMTRSSLTRRFRTNWPIFSLKHDDLGVLFTNRMTLE